jgi:hypothetical protein
MTAASFDFEKVEEIDGRFLRQLKSLFRGQRVKLTIETEDDSFEKYLIDHLKTKSILENRLHEPVTHSFDSTEQLLEAAKTPSF